MSLYYTMMHQTAPLECVPLDKRRLVFGDSPHGISEPFTDAAQRVQNGSRNDEGVSGGDR